jgi:hypothetical protein
MITLALTMRKGRRSFLAMTVLLALCAVLTGCQGGRPNGSSISGKVIYKDQPLGGGTLNLQLSEKVAPLTLSINPDGTFLMTDVSPGHYVVTVETESVKSFAGGAYPQAPKGSQVPDIDTSKLPKYVKIPPKYSDPRQSGLSWDIEKGKNNDKEFKLD